MPLFIVFMAVDSHEPLSVSGNAPGGDTVFGIFIPAILPGGLHYVRIQRLKIQSLQGKIVVGVHKVLIRQHHHGNLIAIRQIEGVSGAEKSLFQGSRSKNSPGELPVPSVQRKEEISLLSSSGHSRGGAWALGKMHHQRRFGNPRETEPLGHEGKSSPRSGYHGPGSSVRGSHRHIHCGNFILHLLRRHSEAFPLLDHEGKDSRSGGHGITAAEGTSSRQSSRGDRMGSVKGYPLLEAACGRERKGAGPGA